MYTISPTNFGFQVTVAGFMSEAEAQEFLSESRRLLTTATTPASGFGMVVDQRDAKVMPEATTKIIEQVMDLYAGRGLKRVALISRNNLSKAQIDRLARAKGTIGLQRTFSPEEPGFESRALAWARDGVDA